MNTLVECKFFPLFHLKKKNNNNNCYHHSNNQETKNIFKLFCLFHSLRKMWLKLDKNELLISWNLNLDTIR